MNTILRRVGTAAAGTAALVLTLTGCGGGGDDDGGRPSVAEVQKALTSGKASKVMPSGLSDAQAKCLAKAFHDSDISDKALRAIVDGDEDFKGSQKDTKALSGIQDDAQKCATA